MAISQISVTQETKLQINKSDSFLTEVKLDPRLYEHDMQSIFAARYVFLWHQFLSAFNQM